MNATTFDLSTVADAGFRSPRLLGLHNLVRKDLADWLHSKRPWIVLGITAMVFALGAANAWINQWVLDSFPAGAAGAGTKVVSLQPLDNLIFGIGTQFTVLAVIFAAMSLLLAERDSGTLAWTISKPVSRTSVLLSKWLTATIVLWVTTVVIPLGATAALVTVLYGLPDLATVAALSATLITVPAIFVAITITAGTLVPSQAAVGAIGLAFFVAPQVVGGIVPGLSPFLPTSIFEWAVNASTGAPTSLVTPFAWFVGMAGLFLVARHRLNAMEL